MHCLNLPYDISKFYVLEKCTSFHFLLFPLLLRSTPLLCLFPFVIYPLFLSLHPWFCFFTSAHYFGVSHFLFFLLLPSCPQFLCPYSYLHFLTLTLVSPSCASFHFFSPHDILVATSSSSNRIGSFLPPQETHYPCIITDQSAACHYSWTASPFLNVSKLLPTYTG